MESFENNSQKESMVERKRQEAFTEVCDALDARLGKDFDKKFESHGREYELTCAEDCMVAFAQNLQQEIKALYSEVVAKNDYREEQAAAKLLELINMYEHLITLYAELRSYYPKAAERVEAHLPALDEIRDHGEKLWQQVADSKE